jgi:hypothetical protein
MAKMEIVGTYFMCFTNAHVQMKSNMHPQGLTQLLLKLHIKAWCQKRKRIVQFVTIWHSLKQGHLMTNFKSFKKSFSSFSRISLDNWPFRLVGLPNFLL